jgi:hypothetical protein
MLVYNEHLLFNMHGMNIKVVKMNLKIPRKDEYVDCPNANTG